MKLWTCLITIERRTVVTQLSASDPQGALAEFISQKIIERILGREATPWSEGAPNRRVLGPDMNDEFVGTWDFTITGGDNEGISGHLIETVDQPWDPDDDEI